MAFRSNWRNAQEWMDHGLPIKSTTSNEAIKLYDCALTQYVGWYDDPQEDHGLGGTLGRMNELDPNFILGKALSIGINLIGSGVTTRRDAKLKAALDDLKAMADKRKSEIEWREWVHVQAIDRFARGRMKEANQLWEEILLRHPTDMMALKFTTDTYFYLGEKHSIRDSVARVYPEWLKRNLPLSCYIHGLYAFGLEETQNYKKAEHEAKLGLEKNPYDAWATHALAHVYEMATDAKTGLGMLSSTIHQWDQCNYLASHNYWHWALFHMEMEEPEASAEILENIITRADKSGSMLDLVDTCSLLYRLELLHPNSGFTKTDQWKKAYELSKPHFDDQLLGFNEVHFAMTCLGIGNEQGIEGILEGIKTVSSFEDVTDNWHNITKTLIEAMVDFQRERFDQTVEKLWRIRYDIINIGGSDAQRDVFNQLLIMAALKAKNWNMCRALFNERRLFKGDDIIVRKWATSIDIH
ncbi:hypothetical protein RDWZM_002146 [Blomia tropicalis]|uniref:Tetratricopeptide repeat protein 38 n=1 Tax=Blomia tropicalis TaxID=40697 RepID=A0A9Q0RRY6_BLOTA|nr:hypothetical protein RDWZM_002146 [Blomia tropicalis]